jgi:hypothetical protein
MCELQKILLEAAAKADALGIGARIMLVAGRPGEHAMVMSNCPEPDLQEWMTGVLGSMRIMGHSDVKPQRVN